MQVPDRIGKYELEKFLGGGMSKVFRARDTVIGRTVAIKILTEEGCADPEVKARFLREAQMSGGIRHENIIQIYDYGEEQGKPFLVMEFLVGQDLKNAIQNGQTGDIDSKLRISTQIARALEHVHSKKIVHRDIKPENIHLDSSGKAKLMDFGIAKAEGLSITRAGFALGTPYYMAPEQVMGEQVGEPADIYAFGILLFELFTGTKPIAAETVERLFYMILNEPVNLGPLRDSGAPEGLVRLVERSTAKKAIDRPQTFTEVIRELEALNKPAAPVVEPVVTPPPPKPEGASGKKIVAAVAVVVLAASSGLIWYFRTQKSAPPPEPQKMTETGLVLLVPAGRFERGPNREVTILPAFYMDKTEVTNWAYSKFCSATNHPLPPDFPQDRPDDPVVNVTFSDAQAYAIWAKKRLPTAVEWEKAFRGTKYLRYPWGNDEDASKANTADNKSLPQSKLMPADSMAEGASPYGILHLAGNASEFVADRVIPSTAAVQSFAELLKPPPTAEEPWYSVKGGSFKFPMAYTLPYEFTAVPARNARPDVGFRCVLDVSR